MYKEGMERQTEKKEVVLSRNRARGGVVNDGQRGSKLKRCRYHLKGNSDNVPVLYAFQTQSSQTGREN